MEKKKKTTSDGVKAGVKKLAIAASSCSGMATCGNATFKALRDIPLVLLESPRFNIISIVTGRLNLNHLFRTVH